VLVALQRWQLLDHVTEAWLGDSWRSEISGAMGRFFFERCGLDDGHGAVHRYPFGDVVVEL
jgi:hypothetical protein